MNDYFQTIKAYLNAGEYPKGYFRPPISKFLPFITLSRETGAGGRGLAQMLLEHLPHTPQVPQWLLLDAETSQRLLNDAKLQTSVSTLIDEEIHSATEETFYQLFTRRSPQDVIYHRLFAMMRQLARRGHVILLGRGSVCATARLPQGLHVRLVAPLERRIELIKTMLGETEEEARELISRQDTARARLAHYYFNSDITDPHLYQTVWNTAHVTTLQINSAILRTVAEMEREPVVLVNS